MSDQVAELHLTELCPLLGAPAANGKIKVAPRLVPHHRAIVVHVIGVTCPQPRVHAHPLDERHDLAGMPCGEGKPVAQFGPV